MPMTPKEMIQYLKKNGWHVKLRNTETGKQVIVPYHSKELKKGLEQAILKKTGVK